MKQINILKQDDIKNPQVLEDKDLINNYLDIDYLIKELELIKKGYDKELRLRTQEKNTIIGNYNLTFTTSNLFDKEKALSYVNDNNLNQDFEIKEIDYKKLQHHIKAHCDYKDFVKLSKTKITIKREFQN